MKRILRSKGKTATAFVGTGKEKKVQRGLTINKDQMFDVFPVNTEVSPEELGNYFLSEPMLFIRQLISILDKVIQKPRSLGAYTVESYRDRCLIAAALLEKVEKQFKDDLATLDSDTQARLRRIWTYKIIPCAKHPVKFTNPLSDDNAKVIIEAQKKKAEGKYGEVKSPPDFYGRLHKGLWVNLDGGEPAPAFTASKIWQHLLEKEFKTDGKVRLGAGRTSEERAYGLALARGKSVSTSTKDPRITRKPKIAKWGDGEVARYFVDDIAKTIFDSFRPQPNETFRSSKIGEMLYDHFGPVWGKVKEQHPDKDNDDDKAVRDPLWALHSDVRRFYRELAKSKRFRIALKQFAGQEDGEENALRPILPDTYKRLVRILKAKEDNAEVGHLIAMGKVIAHTSEFEPSTHADPKETFQSRMDYFLTSQGQSEIKRNEAFARIWRNSVVFAHRTLQVWAASNPDSPPCVGPNFDIYSKDVAVNAMTKHYNTDEEKAHYANSVAILFGQRANPNFSDRSRFSILTGATDAENKAILWGFLRLGGEIRNRTNHFSTKQRLTKLLWTGVVRDGLALEGEYGQKPNNMVAKRALDVFSELLAFDITLKAQAKADLLQMMGFHVFSGDARPVLLEEVSKPNTLTRLTPPGYRKVVRHVTELAKFTGAPLDKFTEVFATLRLDADFLSRPGPDKFRDGILQMLYRTGFPTWLEDNDGAKSIVQDAVKEVTNHQKVRTEKTLQDRDWIHAHGDAVIEKAVVEKADDLTDLLKQLTAASMIEQRLNESYRANPQKQRRVADKVEKFRQEIFAYLFGRYLTEQGLTWLFDDLEEDQKAAPVEASEIPTVDEIPGENWHSQFYAWLYLLPIEHVVKLQQQLRKSRALDLDAKSGDEDEELQSRLDQMDQLMCLLVQVQGAGFNGTEQDPVIETGKIFYEDEAGYQRVINTEEKLQGHKIPGSRRGLRQIAKFDNRKVLGKIIKYHKVTPDEVAKFESAKSDAVKDLFEGKRALHDKIVESCLSEGGQEHLPANASKYRSQATEAAIHDFAAAGARLTDFTRLNQLLMRIIGRLTDYTLLWERDMAYLALGLFYRRIIGDGGELILFHGEGDDDRIHVGPSNPDYGKIQVWDPDDGMVVTDIKYNDLTTILDEEGQKQLGRYSYKSSVHPADLKWHEGLIADGKSPQAPKNHNGFKEIRNDFAHLNILHKKAVLNLCFATNAVRSLFGYDRKLKNAVSQSIRRIVQEDGLDISWTLEHDRLRKPKIIPCINTHLTMLPRKLEEEYELRFDLPRASVRYTSMVKALFEHDRGGYRAKVREIGKNGFIYPRKGELTYSGDFKMDPQWRIPKEVLGLKYPAFCSEIP